MQFAPVLALLSENVKNRVNFFLKRHLVGNEPFFLPLFQHGRDSFHVACRVPSILVQLLAVKLAV